MPSTLYSAKVELLYKTIMTKGILKKMKTNWKDGKSPIDYWLRLDDQEIPLNERIGTKINLKFTGEIHCIHCQRKIKKTFAQGYCYPCFISLAETDMCIVKPHLCHFDKGTCRDNDFAEHHCFIPHLVYLAVSGGAKVGITRAHQKLTRWADQGASYALEVATVPSRKDAGDIEDFLSEFIADKTNWRKMLCGQIHEIDLKKIKSELVEKLTAEHKKYVVPSEVTTLIYPVQEFPTKILSYDFDKNPVIEDKLLGIKGQYLIFQNHVINLRKFQGYEIEFSQ